MESALKTKKLYISNMTCINCQNKIEKKLRSTAGIQEAKVSYNNKTAIITYDTGVISLAKITVIIQKLNYKVLTDNEQQTNNLSYTIGLLIIITALFLLLERFGILNMLVPSRLAETSMGYGMLFVIGLITSIHCIAMCGGINLSQCIPHSTVSSEKEHPITSFVPAFLYNLGRIISYTIIGFILGFVGLLLGTGTTTGLPTAFQGILKLIAGIFMVIMGINMLGIFTWLRKFNLRMPKALANKVNAKKSKSKNPLYIGLLNGLMPCGPLQSMQILALVSGNPLIGAISMFLFSIGTVPLMFGLGSIVSALGKKFTQKVMTVGATLVVVLGLAMFSQGWSLSGFSHIPNSTTSNNLDTIVENEPQVINSTLNARKYPNITVQVNTPVKWVIDAPQGSINGCNNRIFINEYGIEYTFTHGENIIEFIPTKTGTFRYSCWMGMIRATINVVDTYE